VGKERRILDRHALSPLKRILLHIAGIGLILLGIIGLFLPILQGVLMIIAGIGLLSMVNPGVKRRVEGLEKRFPKQAAYFNRLKKKLRFRKKPTSGMTEDIN
jgi:Flp pilus assembly protein TadB